jgi:putative glutamine amidotransferase
VSTSAPLIGISTSEMRAPANVKLTPQGEPKRRELALGLSYPRALERAATLPVVLAPLAEASIDALLERLSGLVLSGGPDIHPEAYGGEVTDTLGPAEPELDAFELALARRAMALGVPILGICRGSQVINVARGGSLHPHLPDLAGAHVEHRHAEAGETARHRVKLEPGSDLSAVYDGRRSLDVNSFHHQAVDRLGDGLEVAALSPDGIVEAIEDTELDFCIGVQWHAETLTEGKVHPLLFTGLAASARRFEAGRRRRRARRTRRAA